MEPSAHGACPDGLPALLEPAGQLPSGAAVLGNYGPRAVRLGADDGVELVLHAAFAATVLAGRRVSLACVAYTSGFHVWDMSAGRAPTSSREIVSVRTPYPVRLLHVLAEPDVAITGSVAPSRLVPGALPDAPPPPDAFAGVRPLLAVCSATDHPDARLSEVKLYSVTKQK